MREAGLHSSKPHSNMSWLVIACTEGLLSSPWVSHSSQLCCVQCGAVPDYLQQHSAERSFGLGPIGTQRLFLVPHPLFTLVRPSHLPAQTAPQLRTLPCRHMAGRTDLITETKLMKGRKAQTTSRLETCCLPPCTVTSSQGTPDPGQSAHSQGSTHPSSIILGRAVKRGKARVIATTFHAFPERSVSRGALLEFPYS